MGGPHRQNRRLDLRRAAPRTAMRTPRLFGQPFTARTNGGPAICSPTSG
jgi:hypothetical protein